MNKIFDFFARSIDDNIKSMVSDFVIDNRWSRQVTKAKYLEVLERLSKEFPSKNFEVLDNGKGLKLNSSSKVFESRMTWDDLFLALRDILLREFAQLDKYEQLTELFNGKIKFIEGAPMVIFKTKSSEVHIPLDEVVIDWILNFRITYKIQLDLFYAITGLKKIYPDLKVFIRGMEAVLSKDEFFINGRKYQFWTVKDWNKEQPFNLTTRSNLLIKDPEELKIIAKQLSVLR